MLMGKKDGLPQSEGVNEAPWWRRFLSQDSQDGWLGVVVHTYNPSYVGDRSRRSQSETSLGKNVGPCLKSS
jgi:hypothetical protein